MFDLYIFFGTVTKKLGDQKNNLDNMDLSLMFLEKVGAITLLNLGRRYKDEYLKNVLNIQNKSIDAPQQESKNKLNELESKVEELQVELKHTKEMSTSHINSLNEIIKNQEKTIGMLNDLLKMAMSK